MSNDTSSTFNPATDIPSLNGKVILITGANTGLGKQAALELAKHSPSHVFMTARDPTKGQKAVDEVLTTASEGTKVTLLELDLASFESVKAAAAKFTTLAKRLDILYLNAGFMGAPDSLTQEGYELQMGVNHLAHALLLHLLLPTLQQTVSSTGTKPRIISLSSSGHAYLEPPNIKFDHLKTPDGGRRNIDRYMQSKLANLVYAREFAAHHPEITMVSLNPGEVQTELFTRPTDDDFVRHITREVAPQQWIPVDQGVKNHLWAASAEENAIESGLYYDPVGKEGKLGPGAMDEVLSKEVWDWTQRELQAHI